ncbi:MAG: hypothetical protein MK188_04975 [Gammaproteobacteria bacterium]|nr:hypothetical protein [Gammaproteobacteria bacterium]
MTTKPSDLIAIANPDLAKKLADSKENLTKKVEREERNPKANTAHITYKQEVWRAVFALNLFRYVFSLVLLGLGVQDQLRNQGSLKLVRNLIQTEIFMGCAILLLCSAILFTIFTKTRRLPLRIILISQFIIDTLTAGFIVHATGSISSGFSLLFFLVVITGSVVLKRTDALALAAGSVLVIFFEHFYSVMIADGSVSWRFDSLAMYGLILMTMALSISHLARLVRRAELQTFVPGNESIEDYLVREEINALKSALTETGGNKTEAAKLLGMTFRSFRYKLSKYKIV